MDEIICVVGPTATGKTAKALELSKSHPSIIISADSRQVYRGMDIVPGKDHPKDIQLHGIDIVNPDEPCSVSVWYNHVIPVIQDGLQNQKKVIVVGGTGLYVKALQGGITTMHVPVNQELRQELDSLDVSTLQSKLKDLDSAKFTSLNESDIQNKRRLVRAIEVASSSSLQRSDLCKFDLKLIGLRYADLEVHKKQIEKRVIARLKNGAIEETKKLLLSYDKNLQSMSAIGYRSIISYLEGELDIEGLITKWTHDELAYVKRQYTWFHKMDVIWYDVDT